MTALAVRTRPVDVTGVGVLLPAGRATTDRFDADWFDADWFDADWFDAAAHLGPRGWKYLTPATRYLLAAANIALARRPGDTAAVADPERLGVVAATSTAIDGIHDRMRRQLDDAGLAGLSPAELPGFSVNIAASQLAIAVRAQALSITLTNPVVAGLEAVLAAARAIRDDRADVVIAGACEDGTPAGPAGAAVLVLTGSQSVPPVDAPVRCICAGLSRFVGRAGLRAGTETTEITEIAEITETTEELTADLTALVAGRRRLTWVLAGAVPPGAPALVRRALAGLDGTELPALRTGDGDGNITGLREIGRLLDTDGAFLVVGFSGRGHVVAVTGQGTAPRPEGRRDGTGRTSVRTSDTIPRAAALQPPTPLAPTPLAPTPLAPVSRQRGRAPYGIRIEDGRLGADPRTAPTLRRIYGAYADGTALREIAELLTREGHPRPGSACLEDELRCTWSKSAVRALLVNPRYREDCAAVLSSEAVRRVDQRFRRSRSDVAETSPRHYPLRGLVRCRQCHRLMQGSSNNDQPYYRCRHGAAVRADRTGRSTAYLREAAALAALVRWPPLALARLRGLLHEDDPAGCAALLRRIGAQLGYDPTTQLLHVRVVRDGTQHARADLCV